MAILPQYTDNKTHYLETVIHTIIEEEKQYTLDIATGFFRIEAWFMLENSFNKLTNLRLLIGRDPSIIPAEDSTLDLVKYYGKDIRQKLEEQELKKDYKNKIDRLINSLEKEHIQVRLYGAKNGQFLHAKAYIFDNYSIVGSSNFTPSGLRHNRELNTVTLNQVIASNLRESWFTEFWEDHSVDQDYKTKLIDELNASKFGSKAYTPYQVFLKALYELFRDENIIDGDKTTLELASFQQEGFRKAVRLLDKYNGCIVADAVGLGKTYIGLRVIEHYLIKERKPGYVPKALIICPAQLRDLVWEKKTEEFGIKATILSHEEISRNSFIDNIKKLANYDLIVVDESHNFRNSATNRYSNLMKVLTSGKQDTKLLLLTATPINNSVFDLYHQINLLTKGNDGFFRDKQITNLKSFFSNVNKGYENLTELIFLTMVRRSRQDVIKRQEAGEEIRIAGKLIKFPKRELEQFTYNFEQEYKGLYSTISDTIDNLNLAPYNIKSFKTKKDKLDTNEVKRNQALVALQKSLYLKRFESSLIAFKTSINNQLNFQQKFYQILTQEGKLLDSKNFRKLVMLSEDEAENLAITDLIDQLESINPKGYDLESLEENINQDITKLAQILNQINQIETNQNHNHYDLKLTAFKELLTTKLKGQKILVFSYFKDTAKYLYNQLINNQNWLNDLGNPVIELITGETKGKQRKDKVNRFAPLANSTENETEFEPIDILICTDVLSEGQNLQDAGILINYDLHWNPVRMIQRAGRIDRLGTDYELLYIYNCFPEEGLEELLGLVARLQERIATIDREVGLDASVLGETITGRSLDQLEKLHRAKSEAEKKAILNELEAESDLVSLDEMKLPLLDFIKQMGQDYVEEIPMGIHSTKYFDIPDSDFSQGGLFLAFQVGDQTFWQLYPRVLETMAIEIKTADSEAKITTNSKKMITDKKKIFNYLKCSAADYPSPDKLSSVKFNTEIFRVLDTVIDNLVKSLQISENTSKVAQTLPKLFTQIIMALTPLESDIKAQVIKVIKEVNLKAYQKDIKLLWESFKKDNDLNLLVKKLDELFTENNLNEGLKTEPKKEKLKVIKREDIKLICYQWFYPTPYQ